MSKEPEVVVNLAEFRAKKQQRENYNQSNQGVVFYNNGHPNMIVQTPMVDVTLRQFLNFVDTVYLNVRITTIIIDRQCWSLIPIYPGFPPDLFRDHLVQAVGTNWRTHNLTELEYYRLLHKINERYF